ncbi:hypothetical protein [Nonomuraea angiospora]
MLTLKYTSRPERSAISARDGTLCAVDERSLEHVAKRFRDSETRTEILRRELAEAIRQADKDGVPQKRICEVTGYTRQQVRRIVLSQDREEGEAGGNADPS